MTHFRAVWPHRVSKPQERHYFSLYTEQNSSIMKVKLSQATENKVGIDVVV